MWFKNRRAKCRQQAQSNPGPTANSTSNKTSSRGTKRVAKSPPPDSKGSGECAELKLLKACSSPVTFPAPAVGRVGSGTPAGGSSAPSSGTTPSPPLTPGYQDYYWGTASNYSQNSYHSYYPGEYYSAGPSSSSNNPPHFHHPYYSGGGGYVDSGHYHQYPGHARDCQSDYLG